MHEHTNIIKQAKEVATRWQKEISVSREKDEQRLHDIMTKMLQDPHNKVFLIELLDQSFRSHDANRIADQLQFIFDKYNNTSFFTQFEQLLVSLFRHLGIYLPAISVPLFIKYLRDDISTIVIKGEDKELNHHIQKRAAENTRVNLNIIGEAVLGEEESEKRAQKYIQALQNPNINYISIKISTIFSQIVPLAHEWSVEEISHRLESIYEIAMQNTFTNAHGKQEHKFVNLDMEEYRDVTLTIDVFMKTLDLEKFHNLYAGIVLQAYLPECVEHLRTLVTWAKERVANGGAPIKVRLVKGANQEMELTEASLRGWECVTYREKAQSDANYKVLMDFLIDPEVSKAVHVGIASHNLFDQAFAMLLAQQRGVSDAITAEMLEGMSESAYHVLKKEPLDVILYAPTATRATFTNAIAYLVRRFDENTAEQNFLRHSFGLEVGTKAWDTLIQSYDRSIELLDTIKLTPYRTQDRTKEFEPQEICVEEYTFSNESDTDFILVNNQKWAYAIKEKWQNISTQGGYHAKPVVAGAEVDGENTKEIFDKSQYHEKKSVGTCQMASAAHLQEALKVAREDRDAWSQLDLKARTEILMRAADEFRKKRADLIGVAAAEVGKVFSETDVEVSEAIDFLNFYPQTVKELQKLEGITLKEKGVGLVISPWNFPIAIPTGGIAASLATGNRVIIKPSSEALLCAHMLCQCFWDAGVSKNTLQFVPTSGALVSEHLISNKDIDFVIFTGSDKTAYDLLDVRPSLHLSAETGGKDATIVTSLADRDQAIKNVIGSAFNNSGQKCSATSLLVLQRELYEDKAFKEMLVDATKSLHVGSVWDFKNRIGALSSKPSGNLAKALEYLDDEEEWLIKPSYADEENPYMLRPSIRWGTKPGDFCHMNELFGPVLSVMCADTLDDAIDIVNSTGYGLTSGIESLDEREQEIFKEKLRAGNLYINRMTTGAIVIRQPFGGMGKSSVGTGKKAGGYNYTAQFMEIDSTLEIPNQMKEHSFISKINLLRNNVERKCDTLKKATLIIKNFAYWLDKEFNKEHDYANIRGESNVIRYLNLQNVLLRFENHNTLLEVICSLAGAKMSGCRVHVSLPHDLTSEDLLWFMQNITYFIDDEDSYANDDEQSLIKAINKVQRARFIDAHDLNDKLYASITNKSIHIATEKFIPHGRIELMHYFIEQSISNSYHRYGNLGLKGLEQKEEL
ncbi:MAG: bifunctional proline dehydrogenase/L-glutamate gamma-semialdehyde dehydrogenase [Helicobacteraceae bacterium]|nr:bifunctional proline dehydrogenase/L-glutamate gamma-semialdehyde dehydrogenase [Helicobacteraceae bacterium]